MGWVRDVLGFWFAQEPDRWWRQDPEFDAEITRRFCDLWQEQRQRQTEDFIEAPDHALATVILFDQFPRNMFRGHAEQFATDHLALAIAEAAVDRGFDDMPPERRQFLYMPFQHSEDLRDQERSLLLFAALGQPEPLRYARLHHDVIARFGRFPHRNAILGRKPRADEIAAGDVVPW